MSIAIDFLAQEAQETQAHEKNNINKILIKIYNFFSAKSNFFLREKRLFLRKISLKIIFFSTKFCFHVHEKRRPQDVSIALDFLAQETQVSHAHAKRSSTRDIRRVDLQQNKKFIVSIKEISL